MSCRVMWSQWPNTNNTSNLGLEILKTAINMQLSCLLLDTAGKA